jgi:hypothetical protein
MRSTLSLLCLVVFLGMATPVQAQLRQDVREDRSEVKLYEQAGPGFTLNKLFSPEHFRMSHSYEMSFGSFGGNTSSLGMYTNTMQWQFNQKLAARVDVSVAHTPFGGGQFGQDGQNPRVFLRNAEIAYRPSDNMLLHLSVRQSPYGSYMGPYGYMNPYMSPYGYYGMQPFGYGLEQRDLFWNERLR